MKCSVRRLPAVASRLWPETLGLAAIGDPKVTRRFGGTARAEYRAVGIHMALSPQQDLASEPRWPRVTATFGADPAAVSAQGRAYVEGFEAAAACGATASRRSRSTGWVTARSPRVSTATTTTVATHG